MFYQFCLEESRIVKINTLDLNWSRIELAYDKVDPKAKVSAWSALDFTTTFKSNNLLSVRNVSKRVIVG